MEKVHLKVFNIKLISEKRSGADAYIDILKKLHNDNISINTYGDKFTEIRTLRSNHGGRIFTGSIINYTVLDPENWYNKRENKKQSYFVDENLYPNAKDCVYYFIPEAHRFCYIYTQGITPNQIENFLKEGLNKVVDEGEEIKVSIEVSQDIIDRILTADFLTRLEVQVSYSNNDLTEDYAELIDNDLRSTHVNEISIVAKSNKSTPLDLQKSKILKGYIQLSKSNGYAKATIRDSNNKKKTIDTKEHPLELTVEASTEDPSQSVLGKIMSLFRRNESEQ